MATISELNIGGTLYDIKDTTSGYLTITDAANTYLPKGSFTAGVWNPRGTTLVTDWISPNGGDASWSENSGQISLSIDGTFWQGEGGYKVLDTRDIAKPYLWGWVLANCVSGWGLFLYIPCNTNKWTCSIAANFTPTVFHPSLGWVTPALNGWNITACGTYYVIGMTTDSTVLANVTGPVIIDLHLDFNAK